jgi:hypothetical protein
MLYHFLSLSCDSSPPHYQIVEKQPCLCWSPLFPQSLIQSKHSRTNCSMNEQLTLINVFMCCLWKLYNLDPVLFPPLTLMTLVKILFLSGPSLDICRMNAVPSKRPAIYDNLESSPITKSKLPGRQHFGRARSNVWRDP